MDRCAADAGVALLGPNTSGFLSPGRGLTASFVPGAAAANAGPVAVVYPEAVWYSYVDEQDIDEIVESHLKNGKVVQRLLAPPHLGR